MVAMMMTGNFPPDKVVSGVTAKTKQIPVKPIPNADHAANHESDSVDQIQRLTEEFGDRCNYLVVRNAAHSDSFAIFESSEVRALLADKLGGREIAMTRLQDWLVEALNAENLTIVAAAQSTTSLVPPLGNDKSKVLTLNLRNRMIFRSADEAERRFDWSQWAAAPARL